MSLGRKLSRLKASQVVSVADSVSVAESKSGTQISYQRSSRLKRALSAHLKAHDRRYQTRTRQRKILPLPGEDVQFDGGHFRVIQTRKTLDTLHGHNKLPDLRDVQSATLSCLAQKEELQSANIENLLFLDTETTGLGGGTGVLPFLIGLGWFENNEFVVEQLFLDTLGQEAALLSYLAEKLEWASCFVTYNGKSYDQPLLRARMVMNRLDVLPERPHFDLLHCARRIFKDRLNRVRLLDLEQRVLGFEREKDIDGAEIPQVYWEFLQSGYTEPMDRVIQHNIYDIQSLAASMGYLVARYEKLHPQDDPRDIFALAKVAANSQKWGKAVTFAKQAASAATDALTISRAHLLWGDIELKHGFVELAVEIWLEGVKKTVDDAFCAAPLHLALAKAYERKIRRYDKALEHAAHTLGAEDQSACEKRVARLTRYMNQCSIDL